jgi:hypothetical protein
MEFLKDITLPASVEHYRLVVLVAAISSMLLLPYIGFVIGTVWLSFRYRSNAEKNSTPDALTFAYRLAECGLQQKSVVVFLGIIPGIAIVFSFAQMLQSTPAISGSLAGFGFLLVRIIFCLFL